LMAADETGTLARLKTYRLEIVDPAIARHQGRIVKTAGDGMIVEFASVVGAVECAVETQRRIARRNADMPPDQKIEFRVGVNLGDVIVEGDDILGDGVNIAARLEALAEPGGIVISGTARDTVRDNLSYALDDLGEVEVKNIPRPVRAFRVQIDGIAAAPASAVKRAADWQGSALGAGALIAALAAGLGWWQPWAAGGPVAVPQAQAPAGPITALAVPVPQLPASIAPPVVGERAALIVLPFANLSGDPGHEFFSD